MSSGRMSSGDLPSNISQNDQFPRRSIPYIKGVSEEKTRFLGRPGTHVSHITCGTLRELLVQHMDPLPNDFRSDVVRRVHFK